MTHSSVLESQHLLMLFLGSAAYAQPFAQEHDVKIHSLALKNLILFLGGNQKPLFLLSRAVIHTGILV